MLFTPLLVSARIASASGMLATIGVAAFPLPLAVRQTRRSASSYGSAGSLSSGSSAARRHQDLIAIPVVPPLPRRRFLTAVPPAPAIPSVNGYADGTAEGNERGPAVIGR